jgi:[glutamine synthetase] adenylyltransferase / [glutamine synthetase]-adenylyl-L-tyrosine phosphorylase
MARVMGIKRPAAESDIGGVSTPLEVSRLLLAGALSSEQVARLLAPYGLADVARADATLQQIAGDPRSRALLAEYVGDLLGMVAETAEPEQALNHWERYLEAGVNRIQMFDYLRSSPRMLHLLCSIFGNSPYLAQTLIRDPLLVHWLAEEQVLSRHPSRVVLARSLQEALGHFSAIELKLEAIRRFKRREMLRIGVRDLLRLTTLAETVEALSELAGVLIEAAYRVVYEDLCQRYGMPMHRDRRGKLVESGFAVIALGKLGGGELNYSSDVDLLYVYESDDGCTMWKASNRGAAREAVGGSSNRASTGASPRSISNEEYFEYLARDLTRALTERTQEGYVFRVDLRLRAEGTLGRLARSLQAYTQYYRTRGQGWERLALLKAWPVAGSAKVGRRFLRGLLSFVYGRPARHLDRDQALEFVRDVKRIKDLIDERMATRGHERRNVKLGTGGIREIEFLVQAVQVVAGAAVPGIRDRNTLGALARFHHHGLLSDRDHTALTAAYGFLRDVEHKLQMVHDLQTHALPDTAEELTACAVRLGYGTRSEPETLIKFRTDLERHTGFVHKVFDEVFEAPERSRRLKSAVDRAARTVKKGK